MNDLIFINDKKKESYTTSRVLAEKFGKRHKNVLQAIEQLKKRNKVIFTALKIKGSYYVDSRGKKNKEYKIARPMQ